MIFKMITPATEDARGTIADILWNESYEHAAIIDTPRASVDSPVVRGNHYHKESYQAIFLVRGSLTYWYKDTPESTEVKKVVVPTNGLVSTPPFEVHTLEITEPTTFIAFSRGLRGGESYEQDTFRVENIIPSTV